MDFIHQERYMNSNTQRWLIVRLQAVGFSEAEVCGLLGINTVAQSVQDDFDFVKKQYRPILQGEKIYQAKMFCLAELLATPMKNNNENILLNILCRHIELASLTEFSEGVMTMIYQQSHIDIPQRHQSFGSLLEAVVEMSIMHKTERLSAFVTKNQLHLHFIAYAQSLFERGDVMPKNKRELKYGLAQYLTKRYQSLCEKTMSWQWDERASCGRISLLFGKYLTADEREILTALFGLGKDEPISIESLAHTSKRLVSDIEACKASALEKLRNQDFLERVLSHCEK